MTPSPACIDLIKSFEGLRRKAYLDGGGVPTIGWGSTAGVKLGDVVTIYQAEHLLMRDLNKVAVSASKYLPVGLTQSQYDALICFAFNVGSSALKGSTLLKKVRANAVDPSIRLEFEKWCYDNGKKIAGLLRRRRAEADLYFN